MLAASFSTTPNSTSERFRSSAIAAPIPTPTAASATLATPPNPNPVAFPGAPNQILASGQYNTNFYNVWTYLAIVAAQLNSCTYAPGGDVTSVTATYPIGATFGACVPGTGANLALALAHGDYDDTTNTQTIIGTKTFTQPLTLQVPLAIASGGTGANSQTFVDVSNAQNISGAKTFVQAVTLQAGGTIIGYLARAGSGTYAFDAVVSNNNNHIEHWTSSGTTAGTSHSFALAFTSANSYQCFATGHNAYGTFAFNTYAAASVALFSQSGTILADAFCIGY